MNQPMDQKNWQELIRPAKLEVTSGRDRRRVATLVAEPLERGFGTTLGNAGYVDFLDQNGDGAINGLDLTAFRSRFGMTLP